MNYRHAYHAGNFADCFKHALLVALVDAFTRKATPFFVLDAHAGAGRYDLDAEPALKTSEAYTGIRRLLLRRSAILARYLNLVEQLGVYPGSPTLIRAILRDSDRMACCELHPADVTTLRKQFSDDPQVEVHGRCGWEALGALLPPREKRGLVFIDPPFEARDEFIRLEKGLYRGTSRFRHGVFAAWYPIKQEAAVREFCARLQSSGIRNIVAVELRLRDTTTIDRLSGCGMVVINPPYQFEVQARSIVEAVRDALGDGEGKSQGTVIRVSDE